MSSNPGPAMHPNLSWRQSPNHRDPIWPARLLIGLVLTILLAGRAFAAEARTFNILHIHADDHRADGLHALGTKELVTPHLDALVARGTTFTRCYTMGSMIGAVCTPSRTMMLTGRSWQRIPGAPAAGANAADPAMFLPKVLAAAGYETWHMGKPSNAFTAGIRAFETNIEDAGQGALPNTDRAHTSCRLADRTIEFLEQRTKEGESRPFYIYLAPPVPHDPRSAEPRFHALYDPDTIPLPAAFLPQHPFDNGEMRVRDEKLAPWPRTPADTRRQLADYYACITGLDHHVGRILTALEASGQLENTIVIFSADNGLSMGEHGLFGKQNLYEFGGMHVPRVVAGPGIPQEYRDKVFEKFFRLEQSRNTRGNGLGLSLVAAIARIHNATISLEDNHPGLRVRLSFPQAANR